MKKINKTTFYKYIIDYEYGIADFYCKTKDEKKVINDFYACADVCFGIRKSLGEVKIEKSYSNVELPIPYRDKGATHFLSHNGDDILFNARYRNHKGEYWKLYSEHGEWCSCKKMGKEELSCDVHHFWVKNHDKVCKCTEKH